jgi:pyrrolidone-carboxylate peptidase
MKKFVISAFGIFGSYLANSTADAARLLDSTVHDGITYRAHVFDADIPTYNRGRFLLELATLMKADAIIALGMASEKKSFCIETVATNRVFNAKYCPPHQNDTPVITDRAYREKLQLDLRAWDLGRFERCCAGMGLATEISDDAGGFCCNHLIYQLAATQLDTDVNERLPWIYVHVPCSPESLPMRTSHGPLTEQKLFSVEMVAAGVRALSQCLYTRNSSRITALRAR